MTLMEPRPPLKTTTKEKIEMVVDLIKWTVIMWVGMFIGGGLLYLVTL